MCRMAEPQMVVDLQQNTESINVTMSCPLGEQSQQLRVTPKKDRRKPKVPELPTSSSSSSSLPLLSSAGVCRDAPHSIPVHIVQVSGKPAPKGRRHDQDGLCQLQPQPHAARGTFRFGGTPSSRWEFDEIPASFGWR